MTGAMRKMGIYLGLVEDDERADESVDYSARSSRSREHDRSGRRDDDYDSYEDSAEYDDYDEEPAPAPVRSISDSSSARAASARSTASSTSSTSSGSSRWSTAGSDSSGYRITTLHPRTYPEARTIGEHLRDGTPVIINLSEMDDADAKRLVDFAAGLTFGLRGSIERVTNKVFLLSPQKVTVTAEDRARIAEGGYLAAR